MKNLLQTKTFWGGIVAILTGISLTVSGNIPEGVNAIVTGLLAILMRDGLRKSADGLRKSADGIRKSADGIRKTAERNQVTTDADKPSAEE